MLLSKLLTAVGLEVKGNDVEIIAVTADSSEANEKNVFVCIEGEHYDGHAFAATALQNGAPAVLVQKDMGLAGQYVVPDTRLAYALLNGVLCGDPARQLRLIGVTGTNGKTTASALIKFLLTELGAQAGLIGTVQNEIGSQVLGADHTTPEPPALHRLFARMQESGCEYAVLEASSQALDQQRLAGLRFSVGIFTNFTQDHLNYHRSMEEYFAAKAKLFEMTDLAVLNADDEWVMRIASSFPGRLITFSVKRTDCDFTARDVQLERGRVHFTCLHGNKAEPVSFPMPGLFSVENALAALACVVSLGYELEEVCTALGRFGGVKGRMEPVYTGTFSVYIDYAHSPDGLENLLTSARSFTTGRILLVFGCGGDRDRLKRPQMAQSAAKYADYIFVTSDNPRSEDPFVILSDIEQELAKYDKPFEVYVDRREAIRMAMARAQKGDVVLLAGKGHESYQVLKDKTVEFDERKIVLSLIEDKIGYQF